MAFSDANRPYNDPLELFWGNKHEDRFIHYQLGYGLKLFDRKHYDMDIQSGLIAEKYFVTSTRYDIVKIDDKYYPVNPVIVTTGKDPNQFDWGFPVEVNANYKISEHAAIGLQAKTSYILGLGVEWLYLMPMVKVQF
ncbi:MAG: hypothetical protein EOP43_06520 [Sphingobacteriaceae bacterium]|nr:MAG: hypothetical protein EOP43_06520 [Sphingobacteriaceae bacterium]